LFNVICLSNFDYQFSIIQLRGQSDGRLYAIKLRIGGKSGLQQGGWLLTGAVCKDWKVPQKNTALPENGEVKVKWRGKSSPSGGQPSERQTPSGARSSRTYGSLPLQVRVDRTNPKATSGQDEWPFKQNPAYELPLYSELFLAFPAK